MIEFKNVKLNIKNIDILNDVNFKIDDNSVTCFIGNKNTGKSSILKILAGVYRRYSGEVYVDFVNLEESNKRISIVFDKSEENTGYNVYEYLKFYGNLANIAEKEIDMYIDKMLKKFLLLSYKYTSLELLDNESTKLVQLIRAMINDPDIILFDNIFIDDNPDYNERILSYIKSLKGKKTLIFASRTLKNIESICDNLGILEAGSLLIFGEVNEVYQKTDLNRKVEVELYDGLQEAVELLKKEDKVSNIIYADNKITFSIDGDKELENYLLKKLTDNDIKVYSYRKENVTFEQLFGKLKDI